MNIEFFIRPNNGNTHGSWPFNTRYYPDRIIFKYTMDYHSIMNCNFISFFSLWEIYFHGSVICELKCCTPNPLEGSQVSSLDYFGFVEHQVEVHFVCRIRWTHSMNISPQNSVWVFIVKEAGGLPNGIFLKSSSKSRESGIIRSFYQWPTHARNCCLEESLLPDNNQKFSCKKV